MNSKLSHPLEATANSLQAGHYVDDRGREFDTGEVFRRLRDEMGVRVFMTYLELYAQPSPPLPLKASWPLVVILVLGGLIAIWLMIALSGYGLWVFPIPFLVMWLAWAVGEYLTPFYSGYVIAQQAESRLHYMNLERCPGCYWPMHNALP
ncbi:MAG: hypothetical protein AAFN41_14125, partial [Planctomycetota bacterium]